MIAADVCHSMSEECGYRSCECSDDPEKVNACGFLKLPD